MTSDPPPTTAWAPITQGPSTMALLAPHAPSSMTMSRPLRGMASWRSRPNLLMSWVPVRTETLWPKKAYSPTVMSPEPTLNSALLTTAVGWMRSRARSPWTRYLYISTWASGPACLGSCSASTWRIGSRSQRRSRPPPPRARGEHRPFLFSPPPRGQVSTSAPPVPRPPGRLTQGGPASHPRPPPRKPASALGGGQSCAVIGRVHGAGLGRARAGGSDDPPETLGLTGFRAMARASAENVRDALRGFLRDWGRNPIATISRSASPSSARSALSG